MKRVVILTGSELRHTFCRKVIAQDRDIEVVRVYTEGNEKNLRNLFSKENGDTTRRMRHIEERERVERDFFGDFTGSVGDNAEVLSLPMGDINKEEHVREIITLNPDLLVSYGCSLIKSDLLKTFRGRFLNVHLGLSPYYRGSGTNFWPLVHGEPEYVGATFMHIDEGIDTGEIIHQLRARVFPNDIPSHIGNRLIFDMSFAYRDIVKKFDILHQMPQLEEPHEKRPVYRNRDCTEESIDRLYQNFKEGLVDRYLKEQEDRCKRVPIVVNSGLQLDTSARMDALQ